MSYDPTQAGDPIPRKFHGTLKCIANEVITMAEAVERGYRMKTANAPTGLYEGERAEEPYWAFILETLDVKLEDGTPLTVRACGKLFTKENNRQDNTQRPSRVSTSFAGCGISLFPGDPEGKFDAFCASINQDALGVNPNYDASKVVGRVFECVMEPMEPGGKIPLLEAPRPEGYLYAGKVRTIARRTDGGEVNTDGQAAPTSNSMVDVTKDGGEEALKSLLGILDGQAADADLFDLLRTSGYDNTTLFDGESLLGVAVNDGALTGKLQEAGYVSVADGKIAVVDTAN